MVGDWAEEGPCQHPKGCYKSSLIKFLFQDRSYLKTDNRYLHNSVKKTTQIFPCFIEERTLLNILSLTISIRIINT